VYFVWWSAAQAMASILNVATEIVTKISVGIDFIAKSEKVTQLHSCYLPRLTRVLTRTSVAAGKKWRKDTTAGKQ